MSDKKEHSAKTHLEIGHELWQAEEELRKLQGRVEALRNAYSSLIPCPVCKGQKTVKGHLCYYCAGRSLY